VLLALDTSTRNAGIALYDGVQVIGEWVWVSYNHHTVELAPAVAQVLQRAGITAADLTVLGVATGPGSFTGLRIGMALAKGLALARHLPMVGVPTLDILAAAQPVRAYEMVAVLQAGRGRLAAAWYQVVDNNWQAVGEAAVQTVDDLSRKIQRPTWVCGELNEAERHLLGRRRKNVILASPAQCLRRPSFLAELAWQRWQAGKMDNPETLTPTYLHYKEPIPG
jgi:tRNA threonylcarbamoyladenosine biosynthesis protein TsaB